MFRSTLEKAPLPRGRGLRSGLVTVWVATALLAGLTGCSRGVIPNTDVEDTADNRAVVDFVEGYRRAVEERDVPKLLAMVSSEYYDDNGTPNGEDDIDFGKLRDYLSRWQERVKDVRYEIRYRRVTYEQDRVYVDVTYTSNFRLGHEEETNDRWSRRLADNRIELQRQGDDQFKILSGM